jgi:uncharacterized protein
MRFLLFLAFCLVLYYLVKNYLWDRVRPRDTRRHTRSASRPTKEADGPPITDELVQDPVCGLYCPKRDTLPLIWQGRAYHFCSEACQRQFRQQHTNP